MLLSLDHLKLRWQWHSCSAHLLSLSACGRLSALEQWVKMLK